MGDQSEDEEDHALNSKDRFKKLRELFNKSSDSVPDDTIKTKAKDDSGISTKPPPKPWFFRSSKSKKPNRGHGTQMKLDRPGKPCVRHVSSDSVDIAWDAPDGFTKGDLYQVQLENNKQTTWYGMSFEINNGKIEGLKPSTTYTFTVRLIKGNGEDCKYGEASEEVTTREEPIPGKPSVQHVYADRVDIIWKRVNTFCKGDVYEVHVENIDTQEKFCRKFNVNCATIEDLQPDSRYVFKVRLVNQNGKVSKYSENSDLMKTCSTFASKLIRTQCQVETRFKIPALYELPLDEVRHVTNADARFIKYEIGPTGKDQIVEKTIMLLGATGTGKSTFVDSLANYVLGVRLTDPYRFTVTKEKDREKQKCQATSQTEWITSYIFYPQEGTRLTYKLNVIDTPGFGDTRGPERDKEIIDQVYKLFKAPGEKGVQTIDAVCFFVKAQDCRLTDAQTYIFNSIQSLLGKDIKGNICLLITFADGSEPPVMHAVKKSGLAYGEKFSFNNLPCCSDPKESTTSMYWEMSSKSFTALFTHLEKLETRSLQLTKDVLKERQRLEVTCKNLQIHIADRISIMKGMKAEMKILQENLDDINRNKNFTYTVKELKVIPVDLPENERATNCLTCKTTCHRNCSTIFEGFPRSCWAFNWFTGYCNQCPQRCDWKSHETAGYHFSACEETVDKTYASMQKKFQDATEKALTVNEVLEKMRVQEEAKSSEIMQMLKKMLQCKNRLNDIALRPFQFSINEQIEQLIMTEKTEGKTGSQDRIQQLTQFLDEAFFVGNDIRSDN